MVLRIDGNPPLIFLGVGGRIGESAMKKEIQVGSNRWFADQIKRKAFEAKSLEERQMLVDEWIREVKVIEKIRKGWEPWMGCPPHWVVNHRRIG